MSEPYTDEKGRPRWRRNDEIAELLKRLHDYLVIGGYPEDHAARYPRLAHTISRLPELLDTIRAEGRLGSIPGVGGTITTILEELLATGTCEKMRLHGEETGTPLSVLELTEIPRLGAKTAKLLYQEHGIDGLATLREALDEGRLDGAKGVGAKMIETMQAHLASRGLGRE